MEMTGEYRIEAAQQKVWEALNDPAALQACIPGCETLEKTADNEFKATVRAKVGPVSARFSGKVTLVDLDPPNGYRIVGEGQGGAAGFAKGGATVRLVSEGAATILRYNADAQVGGKLAQIGSRLIDGTAKKLADEFFSAFAARLAGPAAGEANSPVPGGGVTAAKPPGAADKPSPMLWAVAIGSVVAAILLYIFLR